MSSLSRMHAARDSAATPQAPRRVGLVAFEVAWIFLIFFLFAAWPPPDVGESHYLVKAKHYWQPSWCQGDLFLDSHDAHGMFYWTFGWVTRICSLTATAWIGRALTWLLLAWSWQRLSWSLISRPLVSLLSAGLMLFFLRNFHMAGEWIVGGVEAKDFAYVLVFLALEAIVKNQWSAALLLAGAAGAFHVLVGGWTCVSIGLAWLTSMKDRPRLASLLPAAAGGLILALPGLIPALTLSRGVPADVAREAARVYVFERLSHHLVFHEFSAVNVARFQALAVGWAILAWTMRRQRPLARVQAAAAGALVIAGIGIIVDQGLVWRAFLLQQDADEFQLQAAPILRYYWFRMSDSLIPIGVSLGITHGLLSLGSSQPRITSWLIITTAIVCAANLADIIYHRAWQRLPPAILQPHPTIDSWPTGWFQTPPDTAGQPTAIEWYRDWRAVCRWIESHTPPDAMFLTPREQQTFKWYAGRAEVASWKDIPQDARSLIEWKRRLDEIHPRDREHHRHGLAAFTDQELRQLAEKYDASYIVIDRTRSGRRIDLPRVYPVLEEENRSFEVYRASVEPTP